MKKGLYINLKVNYQVYIFTGQKLTMIVKIDHKIAYKKVCVILQLFNSCKDVEQFSFYQRESHISLKRHCL